MRATRMGLRRLLYRHFRGAFSLKQWLRRRVTKGGLLVLIGLAASAVIGLDTHQAMAYQLFTLLSSLLLVSACASWFFRARVTVARILPRLGTVGEPFSYRIVIHNLADTSQRGLVLFEDTADPRPSFEEFIQTIEPGEERRNWFDRTIGYHRWLWLIARKQPAVMQEQAVPPLPAKGTGEMRLEIVPLQRGYLRLTGVTIARPDPFALFRACVTISAGQSLLVLPRRYPVAPIQLPGVRAYQPGGVASASSVGESEEFVSLRDYRPGDPLRRIHWKSWPRVGKLIVKEYQDEFFVRHALVLDTFTQPTQRDLFEAAVSVAASVACSIETQESLLDLMFIGPEAYCFTAGRGLGNTDKMLEILACVQVCGDKPFEALPQLVRQHHAALSGCICILLAWDAAREHFINQLRAQGVPALVLLIAPAASHTAPTPGPTPAQAWGVHRLEMGRIAEGLGRL